MNHFYRLVFNAYTNTWQAVAETAKSHCKSAVIVLVTALFANQAVAETNINALPTGGQVVAGQSQISQSGNQLTIEQTTQQSIINWNTFNIGSAAQVNYLMPGSSAISLNRIHSTDPSAIFGKLTANGQVWLINNNGILFGQGAQVNVGGLLASSLNIADADFLDGNYKFLGNTGSIVNMGSITAQNAGYVAMLAPEVRNEGVISALQGNVSLAAGDAMTLDFNGNRLINVQVDSANVNALIENKRLIQVGNGQVLMSTKAADNLITSVINNSGRIEADSMVSEGGLIRLTGAKTVINSGKISANSSVTKGGTVHILGQNVGIFDAGSINTSGKTGGGTILVGGDFQGNNASIQNANKTFISQNARLTADATNQGDGGKVIVWADNTTQFYGNISAKGGVNTGNGGFVEVSGKRHLDFIGHVDTSAQFGNVGTLLLDPTDITISTAANTIESSSTTTFAETTPTATSILNTTTLQNALALNNVIVTTASPAAGAGNITVNNTINWTSGRSLTLLAENNLTVAAAITTTGAGAVTLRADSDNSGAGTLAVNAAISTDSGGATLSGVNISSNAAGSINTTGGTSGDAGNISITATGIVNLAAAITANGGTAAANSQGRNAGNITISGTSISTTAAATITANGTNGNGANQAGGNGGAINLTATGNISARAITASGGNGVATNAAGGNAGSININTNNGNITTNGGALNARTGTGFGTGADSVQGAITINNTSAAGTISTGAISTAGNNNGHGGNVSVTSNGNVTLGTVTTSGGGVTGVRAGRNAGNVTIAGATRSVGAITANGSNGIGANQNGGNAGAISITGTGAVTAAAISANGGNGIATNAAGGNAGSVNIATNNGNITTAALSARTGAGLGTGANSTAGFITVNNTSAAGTINTGAISTNGQANGNGGNVSVTGNNNVTVTGAVNASGGTATGTRAGRNAGNVTITGINRNITGAITATGGNAIGTNQAGGNAGVVSITGAGTLNTAAITANTGNRTGAGTPAVAGSITLNGSSVVSTTLSTAAGTGASGGNVNVTTTGATSSSITSINVNSLGAINLNTADTLTISGVVAGTNSILTKTGAGTLVLGGANTYSGATNINAGRLTATSATALGNAGGGTTVANGATLNVNNATIAETAITINGNGVGGAGALTGTNAAVVTGTVTTASNSSIGTTSAASSLTINGRVTAANSLGIVGLGDVTATNATNNFSTININGANDVNLRDTNAITIGNGASNLTGNLTVQSGGNVTVANNITTTGGDITLAGVNFIYTAGTPALSASGRWLVYANTHSGNTFGGLNSGNQAIWNTAYPAAVAQTGNRYVFANSPALTVTSNNQTKTYGQDGAPIVANAYTAAGFINAATFGNVFTQDTIANSLSGSATSTGSATNANVGSYAISVTPITATTGYTLTRNSTGQLTVNPATLDITANDQTKTYGNTFTFANTEFTTSGLQNGETIGTVTLTSAGAVNNANVGSYSITGSGATGGTFSASNYSINYINGNLTVNPVVINLAGNRSYNATSNFAAGTFGTINGVLGQTLNITGTGAVADANIGISKPLSIGTLALGNGTGLASNYTLAGGTHTGTIIAATLNLNAVTDTKVYDGTTNSTGIVGVTGLFGSDTVTDLTQSFASKNVLGTNLSTLNVDAGFTLNDGNGGNNYTVVSNTTRVTISPLANTGNITADNKVYDATNSATIATRNLTGAIAGDDVSYSGGSATFDNKNAGAGKTVTATGLSLTGGDASNYTVNSTATTTADITKASLNLNAVTDTKTYDGTTNSAGIVAVTGLFGSDTVTGLNQSFDNKNAGVRTLAVNSGYIVNDGNGGDNYAVISNSAAGNITPADLTITANNRVKTYGQTVNFTGSEFSSTGLVGTETIGSVNLASAGDINTAGVLAGPYAIIASNATGGTFSASNYNITYNNGILTVNPAPLVVAANNASRTFGSPNPVFNSSISGFVNGENESVLTGTLDHSTSAINTSPVGSYAITPFGLTADNYTITFVDGTLTVTSPTTISVFNSALTRPEQALQTCNGTHSNQTLMISGLDAFNLDNVEYKPSVNQPLIAESVSNAMVNPSCLHF